MNDEYDGTQPPPERADPCAMVIFGATGDLTRRKLLPALLNLERGGYLSESFTVVAVGRAPLSEDQFRERLLDELQPFASPPIGADERRWLAGRIRYVRGELNDRGLYERLGATLAQLAQQGTRGNALFYMAVPPEMFDDIGDGIGAAGLARDPEGGWRRVIVEKPFGRDLETARALNRQLARVFDESQIYRIDHYLGKETVQNLLAFRFANGIFEPIWNRRYVDHVQITVAETVGVEGRGGYYDRAGALRDMVQNHLFQLLALTAMEPPSSLEADRVRDERVKVLQSIRPFSARDIERDTVRGQYAAGANDAGPVPGYREEPTVAPDSGTETYVAMRLFLDNWRWADVPFYLRTGKRLARRVSEIAIQFKSPPLLLFRGICADQVLPNALIVRIQPDEGIALRFQAKVPGTKMNLGLVRMDFKYVDYFGSRPSTGYETLLYDAMTGDSTLFHRADMVETGWQVVTPILQAWEATRDGLPQYPAFSWGPAEADAMLRRDGRSWRMP
ncbi:MAG TPA: glucose-6-phosphate dehydrogenase [Vicinamibacterales bacterium]